MNRFASVRRFAYGWAVTLVALLTLFPGRIGLGDAAGLAFITVFIGLVTGDAMREVSP